MGKKNGKAWEIFINEDILITMWRSQNTKEKSISILCMYYWSFKYLAINIAKHFVQLWHTYTIISNNGIVKSPYLNSQTILGKTSFFSRINSFKTIACDFLCALMDFLQKTVKLKQSSVSSCGFQERSKEAFIMHKTCMFIIYHKHPNGCDYNTFSSLIRLYSRL